MTGAWVTWSGDVLMWPGVDDITPNLNQAVAALPWRDDVHDARCDYTRGAPRVVFHILVRWGITEVVAKRQAIDALRACLPPAGITTPRDHNGPHTVATIRVEWWPYDFRWYVLEETHLPKATARDWDKGPPAPEATLRTRGTSHSRVSGALVRVAEGQHMDFEVIDAPLRLDLVANDRIRR